MMKLLTFLLGFSFAAGIVSAQTNLGSVSDIQPLTVGDTVPDLVFTELINHDSRTARLSDFKGKLVILDFWATWCAPCVSALPKMNALQQKYRGQIQIIAITMEKKDRINSFLKKHKATKDISSLLFLTDDSVISKVFPYQSIPHEVWIGKDNIVKAITSDQYVTAENINSVLNGQTVNWHVKEESKGFSYKTSIFENINNENLAPPDRLYYSGFTGYLNGASAGQKIERDSMKGVVRYNQYNLPLLSLYSYSFNKFPVFDNPKRCVFNVADISKFVYNKHLSYMDEWIKDNCYSYESNLRNELNTSEIKRRFKGDLDFYFRLTTYLETRRTKCLILKIIDRKLLLNTKGELPTYELAADKNNYIYTQKNKTLYDLAFTLNYDPWLKELPLVIDETNYTLPIDFEFKLGTVPADINSWRRFLNRHGLDLIPEEREIEMLIISDKDAGVPG